MRQATEEHSPSSSDEESEEQFYEDFLPIIRIVVAVVAVVVCVIECGIFEEPSDEPNSKLKKTKKRKRMDPQEGLVSILEKLSKQIDVLIEKIKDLRGCSFPEAMEAVESLPGVQVGGELWRFATRLFKVQEERKMFSTLKKSDPDIILDWLNYRLNSDSSSS